MMNSGNAENNFIMNSGMNTRPRLQDTHELPAKKIQLGGEYVTNEAAQRERLSQEHLDQQHAQIQLARSITRISPVAIVQHLLEVFAGTGFERHLQFVENVQRLRS